MQEQIQSRALKAIQDQVFPGCVVGVFRNGQKEIFPFGNFTYDAVSPMVLEDTQYDVASITKSIPTASIALKLVEEGKMLLNEKLSYYVPEYQNSYKDEVLIKHLLTYSVKLDLPAPGVKSVKEASFDEIWETVLTRELKYPPETTCEYSNPPAMLLTRAIENVTRSTLDVLSDEYFFKPLEMSRTTFHPVDPIAIPPTEIDDWRGLVQGVVHDETAYVLGKKRVVGCAGIFSTASDILTFLEMLLNKGEWKGKRYFSESMVRQIYTNQLVRIGATMGLGWELCESRFMGKFADSSTFGKTGFTGTVCVADPKRSIAYVILSNRTYPKRSGPDEINSFRRDIADIILTS